MVLRDQFPQTLMALAALRATYAGDIELILVDTGSTDETRHIGRYVRGAQRAALRHRYRPVRACNAALHCVTADAVLFLRQRRRTGAGRDRRCAAPACAPIARIGAVGGKVIRGAWPAAGGRRDRLARRHDRWPIWHGASPLRAGSQFRPRRRFLLAAPSCWRATTLLQPARGLRRCVRRRRLRRCRSLRAHRREQVSRGVRSRRRGLSHGDATRRPVAGKPSSIEAACRCSSASTSTTCGFAISPTAVSQVFARSADAGTARAVHRGYDPAAHARLGLRAVQRHPPGDGVDSAIASRFIRSTRHRFGLASSLCRHAGYGRGDARPQHRRPARISCCSAAGLL